MGKYDDIINLPAPVSKTHKQMSMRDRAAQFAPFAALTGYEEAVDETARLTDTKAEANEETVEYINSKLVTLKNHLSEKPEVTVTYFVYDEFKAGGKYAEYNGVIKKIDEYGMFIYTQDGEGIPIDDIIDIDGDIFGFDFVE